MFKPHITIVFKIQSVRRDSPSKFDRILADFDHKPLKMSRLTTPQPISPIVFNPTPSTRARRKTNAKTPILEEQDNPFLDAATSNAPDKELPHLEETELLRAPKRQKLTQDYKPTQPPPPKKVTRWADLEDQLVAATYRVTEPQSGPPSYSSSYEYNRQPPKKGELLDSLASYGLPSKIYRVPFYSKEEDVPKHPMRYAGRVFHIKGGTGVGSLERWGSGGEDDSVLNALAGVSGWEYAGVPPSSSVVKQWLDSAPSQGSVKRKPDPKRSQVRVYAVIWWTNLLIWVVA
jgi:hypothetical protein